CWNASCGCAKAFELHRIERMILVGTGEVAVQRVDRQDGDLRDLLWTKAEPVHPRVDHHVAFASPRNLAPPLHLLYRVEARARFDGERGIDVAGSDPVQDDQVRVA